MLLMPRQIVMITNPHVCTSVLPQVAISELSLDCAPKDANAAPLELYALAPLWEELIIDIYASFRPATVD